MSADLQRVTLANELARLLGVVQALKVEMASLKLEIPQIIEDNKRLRGLLQLAERIWDDRDARYFCVWCSAGEGRPLELHDASAKLGERTSTVSWLAHTPCCPAFTPEGNVK